MAWKHHDSDAIRWDTWQFQLDAEQWAHQEIRLAWLTNRLEGLQRTGFHVPDIPHQVLLLLRSASPRWSTQTAQGQDPRRGHGLLDVPWRFMGHLWLWEAREWALIQLSRKGRTIDLGRRFAACVIRKEHTKIADTRTHRRERHQTESPRQREHTQVDDIRVESLSLCKRLLKWEAKHSPTHDAEPGQRPEPDKYRRYGKFQARKVRIATIGAVDELAPGPA